MVFFSSHNDTTTQRSIGSGLWFFYLAQRHNDTTLRAIKPIYFLFYAIFCIFCVINKLLHALKMMNVDKLPQHMSENELAAIVVEISFQIHKKWGPGLLENVYEALLVHHLKKQGIFVEQQKSIPFEEEGIKIDIGFRTDLIIEQKLVVELKSVEKINPVFLKTLLTYLRILDLKLGLLINFGESYLNNGIKRMINGYLD